jgi:hypothetical protein
VVSDCVGDELLGQRSIQTELGADLLDRFVGGGLTGEERGRIARQRPRQQERDHHHPDQVRQRADDAPQRQTHHGAGTPMKLTWAATTRQPAGMRTQVCC